jgi:trehalose 6-phosphate phosphatase
MRELLSPGMAPVLESLALPGTLIVLDFDGTLAPIVTDPAAAHLSARTRTLLGRLARLYPVAVLSGRAAPDVSARLEHVPVRWVVGSHGAEWPGEERAHRAWRKRVASWEATLTRRLAGEAGLELEVKPLSLAIHYRRSRRPRRAVAAIAAAIRGLAGAEVVLGKKVVNLVPRGAGDKGTALARLAGLARARRVLFVGDDVTDEAAFGAALDIPAVTARVGWDPATRAGAWLRHRADVDVLLERLCRLRQRSAAARLARPAAEPGAASDARALGPVLHFMKDLWALEQGLQRRSRVSQASHGVTGPQRLVVRVVDRLGPISPARLARVLHLHPSSVTRLVRRLVARGLIRRTPNPEHRGRFLLSLGPRGGRVERLDAGTVESAVSAALKAAGPRDIAATRRVLELVTSRLAGRP